MEDVILELSQRDTDRAVYPIPGEFHTILAKNTFIYPGDEVTVSKTFVDTQAETSGVISVDNDTTIRMDWGIYTQNWLGTDQFREPFLNSITKDGDSDMGDVGREGSNNYGYIFSERRKTGNGGAGTLPPRMINIYRLHAYSMQYPESNSERTSWGDPTNNPRGIGGHIPVNTRSFPVQFTYHDGLSVQKTFSIDIPFNKDGDSPQSSYVFEVDILADFDSINQFAPFRGINPTQPGGGNWYKNWAGPDQSFHKGTPCIEFLLSTPSGANSGKPINPPAGSGFPTPGSGSASPYVPGTWFGPNGGSFTGTSGDDGDANFCMLMEFQIVDRTDTDAFVVSPKTFAHSFVLPAGKYLPADICDKFNQEMDNTDNSEHMKVGHLSNNQLLWNSSDIKNGYGGPDSQYLWLSEGRKVNPLPDGTQNFYGGPFHIQLNENRWVGTNQFDLQYDAADQHFYFNYLHMPIYTGATPSTVICKPYKSTGGYDPLTNVFEATRHGGIFFTGLESSEVNAQGDIIESNFWNDKLGFIPQDLIPPPVLIGYDKNEPSATVTVATGIPAEMVTNTYTGTTHDLTPGIFTTAAASKLDSIIPKGVGLPNSATGGKPSAPKQVYSLQQVTDGDLPFTQAFTTAPAITTFPLSHSFTSNFNNVIKATNAAVSGELLDSGYYLLELTAGLRMNVLDHDKLYTNLSAIINRYYSLGSYTSTGIDNTLSYIHKGEVMNISDVNVRILDPHKKPAKIGFDNTIFLSVKRGEFAQSLGQPQPPNTQK